MTSRGYLDEGMRSASVKTQALSGTDRCIMGFIEYINDKAAIKSLKLPSKLASTNQENVFENLIVLMQYKGFVNLTKEKVFDLTTRIGSDLEFNRDKLFKEIADWAGIPLPILTESEQKKKAKGARNDLTLTDKLERVTQILSGPTEYTCTKYIDCPGTPVSYPKTSQQVKWLNQLNYKNKTITSFKSKRCATCWICNGDINIYEMNTGTETIYNKCGEDEHVLPPGVGNIFGLLYPSEYDTIRNRATPIIESSLRPSHQWCNRVKSGIILILGPDPIEQQYRINEKAMTKILEKAKNWLLNGKTVMLEPDYSFHNKKKTEIQPFINNMEHTMKSFLEPLCRELNRSALGNATTLIAGKRVQWTMYLLRLVFNCCIIGFTVIYSDNKKFKTKWIKHGGQIGGALDSDELNLLANFIVEPASICENSEDLLIDDTQSKEPRDLPIWQQIMNRCTSCTIDERVGAVAGVVGCCLASRLGYGVQTALASGVATGVAAYNAPKTQTMERGGKNNKNKKYYYYMKTKKQRKPKRNTKKYRKSRKIRGGVKKTKEQIQKEMMANATPITDPTELNRLAEADIIAEERERNDNEIKRINDDLERQRINSITSFPSTPMSPEDARRQQEQDELDNARVNSAAAKARKLTIADLGGSKRKNRKGKKARKSKKLRGGNRFGGNNIGANCYDPNFSIYNTNMLKLFPYKGGELQLDDPYKNSEGSQY
jgi:hypothetical protein